MTTDNALRLVEATFLVLSTINNKIASFEHKPRAFKLSHIQMHQSALHFNLNTVNDNREKNIMYIFLKYLKCREGAVEEHNLHQFKYQLP